MTPSESGALKNGTLDERKQNQLVMEQRRDILVATIDAYDQAIVHIKQQPLLSGRLICRSVVVPSPKEMRDRSCGSTFQEAKKLVRTRVQWLIKQIGIESLKILDIEVENELARRHLLNTGRENPEAAAALNASCKNVRRAGSVPTREPQKRQRTRAAVVAPVTPRPQLPGMLRRRAQECS